MRRSAIVLVLFLMLNICSSAFAGQTITIQVEASFPPFSFTHGDDLSGFAVELSRLIFASNDYDLNLLIWGQVQRGEIHSSGLVGVTEERKNAVLFTKPVVESHVALYARTGTEKIDLKNLSRFSVGVQKADYAESILRDKLGVTNYQTFDNYEQAAAALIDRRIDFVFGNQEVINYLIISQGWHNDITALNTNLYPTPGAFGVAKGNPELVAFINRRIDAIQKSGLYEDLYRKYFYTASPFYRQQQRRNYYTYGGIALAIILLAFALNHVYIGQLRRRISRATDELRESEGKYRGLFQLANDAILLMQEDIIVDCNAKAVALFGAKELLVGRSVVELSPEFQPDGRSSRDRVMDIIGAALKGQVQYFEWSNIRDGGKLFPVEVSLGTVQLGEQTYLQAIVRDISERKRAEETIRYQAYYDKLTGLPNRQLFQDRVMQALAQADKGRHSAAVIFLDLDRFQTINDTLGHAMGDQLLQAIAARLSATMQEQDTVARWSGDEFALLLPHVTQTENVVAAAQSVLACFREPWILKGDAADSFKDAAAGYEQIWPMEQECYLTASIGISLYPTDGVDGNVLLRNADVALYRAKAQGKDNFQFFTPAMNTEAVRRVTLENQLRRALDRQEFVLHYMPQMDLISGELLGMEALIRWQHPTMGVVSPLEFIPLAEETGMIFPIGEWVLRSACAQNKAWQDQGLPPMRVSVNISALQFADRNLVTTVARVLRETGLSPEYLGMEITESVAMKNVEHTIWVMREMQKMGIRTFIDDFGTDYSSLSYLKKLPIDALKIDRSFISDLAAGSQDTAIVDAVIALAHSLQMKVVAEGVETPDQLALLQESRCDEGQGYFFSRAVPAEEFVELLSQKKPKH